MNKALLFVLALGATGLASAAEFDYENVTAAGTGVVADSRVRYLASSDSRCVVIQHWLNGNTEGAVEKQLCSLQGVRFEDGYAAVELIGGLFRGGGLFLGMGFTPLNSVDETIMLCEVLFVNALADHLSCTNSMLLNRIAKRSPAHSRP